MVALSPLAGAGWQFFDSNGAPLAGGKLYTYVAGTSTPAATYTSTSGATPNTNPIILDSAGRLPAELWLTVATTYKFMLTTAAGGAIWTQDNISGMSIASDLTSFETLLAGSTGATLVGYGSSSVNSALNTLLGDRGPILLAITGQSNAVGVNNGGSNPSNSLVKTWNPATSAWVSGGQYTAAPWTSAAPDGNGGNNNFSLGAAHYLAQKTGRAVYIVYDAYSGQSITQWVPATQPRYASLKSKVAAALLSADMVSAGKTQIDALIWAQGEENCSGVNVMSFSTYTTNLSTLDTQFRGESWVSSFTPFFIMGMSQLHDRYQISPALQAFSNKSNGTWRYLSTRSLRTQYQTTGTGDNTHWLGPSLWEGGYNIIGPAILNNERVSQEAECPILWNRGNGNANAGDTTVIASYDMLLNWPSRTSGVGLAETFSGNGATTAFVLDYRGTTITSVTVNGVAQTTPANYSVSTASDGRNTITFVSAPAAGTNNIIVNYDGAISGPAASNSIGWGYACYPDGNFTLTGGYIVATDNLCGYSLGWGRELYAGPNGDYGAFFGFQNNLMGSYGGVFGRGNTVADDYSFAVGKFAAYTAAQADPVLFQVGNGASTSSRSNAFAVRASGRLEATSIPTYASNAAAISGGLIAGQFYKTNNSGNYALMIVV